MKIGRSSRSSTQQPVGAGNRLPLILLLGLIGSTACLGQTTLWKEGFETDDLWDSWHVDGGVWGVGAPTTGPGKAFAGARCAATVLDGDYPLGADARLVRDQEFTVPPASEHPRLRFWHWFRGGEGATRNVEIKVGAADWQPIAASSGWTSESWSRASFDLSPFSGQPVQIAFHFQSATNAQPAAGWYVDEVTVETGSTSADFINSPEGFEAGLGDWSIDHGIWQLGSPTDPRPGVFAGTNCVATALNGFYPPGADSRLISPEFVVPETAEWPRLRFWHWFSIYPGDYGQVEISVAGGAWQPLSDHYDYNGSIWTRPSLDLRPWSGESVQVAFHFYSGADFNVAKGWFIDEVVVETGPMEWDPVNQPEGFESGLGNWVVDRGTWTVGAPLFAKAFEGQRCAGTVLTDNYTVQVDSRLISPEFTVPTAADHPRLRFWQWLRNQTNDPATVEIRVVGGDWKALSDALVARDGTWARSGFSLEAYGGQRVQIAFHFQSNDDGIVDLGWLIDQVMVETGPAKTDLVSRGEDFEQGIGDWVVDHGTWEVGAPNEWPFTAHSGTQCAGTVIRGNYGPGIDSRLISPDFTVPDAINNPRLRFWQWFSIVPGDFGTVEISVAGGPWQALSEPMTGNGGVWTSPLFDLRPFAGQTVRIAFRFQSNSDNSIGRGWYVDDVVVQTGPIELQSLNQSEGFESGLGNWSVDHSIWEVGVPTSGPGSAFKGTNCAATVLGFAGGNYFQDADSRLISPEFTVPCVDAGPRLRFQQWYDIASGDEGTVEVREPGGPWQTVLGPISGQGRQWTTGFYDLSAYAGQRLQLAFHFRCNNDAVVSSGWYIDEVRIQATVLAPVEPMTVREGDLLSYRFATPCQNFQFSLGSDAPAGASIDPALGILLWVPTEAQGPGVYPIEVSAADPAHPADIVDRITLEVTVSENNTAPVIPPIDPQPIVGNVPLRVAVKAYDADLPAQHLTFSLDEGAPAGASIDPATGVLTWTPTPTDATYKHTITVRVTDDGDPPLSASTSFDATPAGSVPAMRLQITRLSPDTLVLTVSGGQPGVLYQVESTTELNGQPDPNGWEAIQGFWKGDDDYTQTTSVQANPVRFYRVRTAL